MSRADLLNALAFAATLALSAAGGALGTGPGKTSTERQFKSGSAMQPEVLADGTRVLRDAGGVAVPLKRYQRIASATMAADRVLADLCEPQRVVAFSRAGQESAPFAHRYVDKAGLSSRAPLEEVLALKPDLLLVSALVDPGYAARLRERGIAVFDLGHMRGMSTLLPNIRAIGWLLGAPERGESYARSLARRMAAASGGRVRAQGPRAVYVSAYGTSLYGGANHTSYHDVIVHAGLRDAAAEAGLSGWPQLSAEQLLSLAPEVVVTKPGMGALLCRHAGLASLGPCKGQGRILELPGAIADDPGPGMLEATEALADRYRQP